MKRKVHELLIKNVIDMWKEHIKKWRKYESLDLGYRKREKKTRKSINISMQFVELS